VASKVDEFLDSLSEPTVTDLILLILGNLSCQNINRNMIMFQKVFYDLSKKYPLLEQRFRFNTSGIYPYSEELERAIYRLEWAQALGAVNPSYTSYQVDKKQVEESRQKYSPYEIEEIEQISREFEKHMGEYVCYI